MLTENPGKRKKIINDPVHGFIHVDSDIQFQLIEHPYFQRLRRIRQLGMTNLVYPGTNHTRFQHALGALHLMDSAIQVIRAKGHDISPAEEEAVKIAILLHDIGHGPFSHTLELSLIKDLGHEDISKLFMEKLNEHFNGQLSLAIQVFNDAYPKKFLHQLVSGQLDMDRLDYLKRDSFFSGVSEGTIGSDRIIKMLNVVNDKLVVESKGIYSIEKFLIARRLMYWQVYLHKTVLSAENLLINIFKRAGELVERKSDLFLTPDLSFFLKQEFDKKTTHETGTRDKILFHFAKLDDTDIIVTLKNWMDHPDKILSCLSRSIINRKLYKIELQDKPFSKERVKKLQHQYKEKYQLSEEETPYFVFTDSISNNAYSQFDKHIDILFKTGAVETIENASDIPYESMLSKNIKKYFLCYPKDFF